MKLAAIYNIWDGEELLEGSIKQIYNDVDLIIIIWQEVSNFGEHYKPLFSDFILQSNKIILHQYHPESRNGFKNETKKRQLGIEIAKQNNCTHFLHLDCDEYYEDFKAAKEEYIRKGQKGSVCKIYTYFKSPCFRLETPDGYFVPFIHLLKPTTKAGHKIYSYWCDPTRRINESDVTELDVFMHHFSWVRKDIGKKVRNSSAKSNIERGTILKDYESINSWTNPNGYYIKDLDKKIILVPDRFNISEKV